MEINHEQKEYNESLIELTENRSHLQTVLLEYFDYYETARPHQGLGQQMPIPGPQTTETGPIKRRKVLGGIINDYHRDQSAVSCLS